MLQASPDVEMTDVTYTDDESHALVQGNPADTDTQQSCDVIFHQDTQERTLRNYSIPTTTTYITLPPATNQESNLQTTHIGRSMPLSDFCQSVSKLTGQTIQASTVESLLGSYGLSPCNPICVGLEDVRKVLSGGVSLQRKIEWSGHGRQSGSDRFTGGGSMVDEALAELLRGMSL